MTIDTIFLCFCEDTDRNDGVDKPYYMSKGLMEFVENSNEALAAEERRRRKKKVAYDDDDSLVSDRGNALPTIS